MFQFTNHASIAASGLVLRCCAVLASTAITSCIVNNHQQSFCHGKEAAAGMPSLPLPTQSNVKQRVGYAAVDRYVKSNMIVGLGTG